MDEKQLLRDPDIEPTSDIIAEGLSTAYKTYTKFIKELESYGITLMDWRFYNDGKAWLSKGEYRWTGVRGGQKVTPIFWLSIWEGFFKTSFFFGFDIKEELLQLPISQEMKELIENAKPMGKTMRFMPVVINVANEEQLSDIYTLTEFRKIRVK